MTIDELEDFYGDHPDGRFYESIFAEYPLKTQLKVVSALKARLDRSADVDRRRRITQAFMIKHQIRQRERLQAAREQNDRRLREYFNQSLESLRAR